MEKILSNQEAEAALELLSENDRVEIERDIIRFGEYYIGTDESKPYRLNPLNIITVDGNPKLILPDPLTEI